MQSGTVVWFDSLVVQPVVTFLNELSQFLPTLIGALVLLGVGWVFAKAVQRLIARVLKTIKIDKFADSLQVTDFLIKGGIRHRVSDLIGIIVYWLLILAVVMVSFNALHLTVAAELLQSLVSFLPNVIAAVFILILGIFAASFLSTTIRTIASNAGITQSLFLGQLVQTTVIIFSSVAALQQLQIQFVGEVFLIILGGISLACAIAFGVGCKDIAAKWVNVIIEEIQSKRE